MHTFHDIATKHIKQNLHWGEGDSDKFVFKIGFEEQMVPSIRISSYFNRMFQAQLLESPDKTYVKLWRRWWLFCYSLKTHTNYTLTWFFFQVHVMYFLTNIDHAFWDKAVATNFQRLPWHVTHFQPWWN